MTDDIKMMPHVIGTKQTKRAIKSGHVRHVIVATDVDDKLVQELLILFQEVQLDISIERKHTMEELGKHCGIDVGAAMVAILKEDEGGEMNANN